MKRNEREQAKIHTYTEREIEREWDEKWPLCAWNFHFYSLAFFVDGLCGVVAIACEIHHFSSGPAYNGKAVSRLYLTFTSSSSTSSTSAHFKLVNGERELWERTIDFQNGMSVWRECWKFRFNWNDSDCDALHIRYIWCDVVRVNMHETLDLRLCTDDGFGDGKVTFTKNFVAEKDRYSRSDSKGRGKRATRDICSGSEHTQSILYHTELCH